MVAMPSSTHSLPWAKSSPTFVSAPRSFGGLPFILECDLHGSKAQLLALCGGQFVHPRAVLLYDPRTGRLPLGMGRLPFHALFIPPLNKLVKPAGQSFSGIV